MLGERGNELEVLLEVKLSGEGANPARARKMCHSLLAKPPALSSSENGGLDDHAAMVRRSRAIPTLFPRLAELAQQYGLPQLSMGMSGDFEVGN